LSPQPGPIDAHVHLWDLARTPQPWIDASMVQIDRDFGADDLGEHLAAIGAGSAVVVQADHSLDETEWLLDLATRSSAIAGVVGWVNLDGDPTADLARLHEHPTADRLVGIRHLAHVDPDPAWLMRPGVIAGVRALGAAGLAFDLVVRDHQLPLASSLAGSATETTLVLDHLGNPQLSAPSIHEWARELRALAAHERVVAKLSGLVLEAARAHDPAARLLEAVEVALEQFGPARLMMGSDWPLVLLDAEGGRGWAATVADLIAELSASERDSIMRGTAIAAYGDGMGRS
jgi:L-fuconolactonase